MVLISIIRRIWKWFSHYCYHMVMDYTLCIIREHMVSRNIWINLVRKYANALEICSNTLIIIVRNETVWTKYFALFAWWVVWFKVRWNTSAFLIFQSKQKGKELEKCVFRDGKLHTEEVFLHEISYWTLARNFFSKGIRFPNVGVHSLFICSWSI